MAIILAEGFETQDMSRWTNAALLALNVHKNGETKYWMRSGDGNTDCWLDNPPSTTERIYLSFNFMIRNTKSLDSTAIGVYDEDTNYLFTLRLNANGQVYLQLNSGVTSGIHNMPLNVNESYSFVITCDTPNDYVTLDINGELALEVYGALLNANFGQIKKLRFTNDKYSQNCWDDVFLTNDVGEHQKMAGVFIKAVLPVNTGNYNEWSTEPSTITPQSAINEPIPDDSDYIYSNMSNQRTSFTFTNPNLGTGIKIIGVKPLFRLHKNTAGIQQVRSFFRVSGIDYTSDAYNLEHLEPRKMYAFPGLALNPATGEVWSQGEISTLELGISNE